jgi:methyl-accepting chemotaxis protein
MNFSIKLKLIAIISVLILVGTSVIGIFSITTLHTDIINCAHQKLASDLAFGSQLIDKSFPGNWTIRDSKLYKGESIMNDNPIVDDIGKLAGDNVTIFQGNTRVATNVKKEDGTRAVGTTVAPAVEQMTLKEGKTYNGEAVVVGVKNQSVYEPIKDSQGSIIGMMFVGVPNAPYDAIASRAQDNIVVFILVELLLAIGLIWFISNRAIRPLLCIVDTANQVAKENLNVTPLKIRGRDEFAQLGRAVNSMVDSLRTLISEIDHSASSLALAAEEITVSIEETTNAANNMATSTSETSEQANLQKHKAEESASLVIGISSGIRDIARASQAVQGISITTADEATHGSDSIRKVVSQMGLIGASVDESVILVDTLNHRSNEVSTIVSLINDIASQTNLLALNAAIEAARAGEQGRGFAVVADEVRKLAEQTASSTGRVSDLVNAIQSDTTSCLQGMDRVHQQVKLGLELVNKSGETFTQILDSIQLTAKQVGQVSGTTQELLQRTEVVKSTMNDIVTDARNSWQTYQTIASSCEEQLAAMEEVGATSEELTSMAQNLKGSIEKFRM